jgi:hypothetical protein
MLTYYVIGSKYFQQSDVKECSDIKNPLGRWSSVQYAFDYSEIVRKYPDIKTSGEKGYEYLKKIIINEIYGTAEYEIEKNGGNNMTDPYVSATLQSYKDRVPKLTIKPQIEILLKQNKYQMFPPEPPPSMVRLPYIYGEQPFPQMLSQQPFPQPFPQMLSQQQQQQQNASNLFLTQSIQPGVSPITMPNKKPRKDNQDGGKLTKKHKQRKQKINTRNYYRK